MNNEVTLLTRFGFFLGAGTMGVIAGLGLGSKEPNKLALLVGVGSLIYANQLNQVVKVDPRLAQRVKDDVRSRLPFQGPSQDRPTGQVQVRARLPY